MSWSWYVGWAAESRAFHTRSTAFHPRKFHLSKVSSFPVPLLEKKCSGQFPEFTDGETCGISSYLALKIGFFRKSEIICWDGKVADLPNDEEQNSCKLPKVASLNKRIYFGESVLQVGPARRTGTHI